MHNEGKGQNETGYPSQTAGIHHEKPGKGAIKK
jgi:hypothetical protein